MVVVVVVADDIADLARQGLPGGIVDDSASLGVVIDSC
jgi:hypothetical protein